MVIEVVSYPADLGEWDSKTQPFYLELFGETHPLVDTAYAEVTGRYSTPVIGNTDGTNETTNRNTPIYEYWWTIGHTGEPQALSKFWRKLRDPAARVYLYFPTTGGWRANELVATVNYLQPVPTISNLRSKASNALAEMQPLISGAGQLAKLAPLPGASDIGALLSTVGKLQLNTVPRTGQFAWSVGKVTSFPEKEVAQGVMWTLPPAMFTQLGGRITGSVAVTFIHAHRQKDEVVSTEAECLPEPRAILAHAVVYGPGGEAWAPQERKEFIRLRVAPQPTTGRGTLG